jgi:hypothetical protein
MHSKQSLWTRIGDLVSGSPERVSVPIHEPVPVTERGVRLPLDGYTFEVDMGGRRLHVSPDLAVTGGDEDHVHELMLLYPDRYYGRIGHFARLEPGATLNINPGADGTERLFTSPTDALRTSVRFRHDGEILVIKATSEPESFVKTVDAGPAGNRVLADRKMALRRLGEILDGVLDGLAPEPALALARRVNHLMETEPCRVNTSDSRPGGIVELPEDKTPIVVGDLHGQVENLLTLLCQNAFLESLERREAALVFLGDAVHLEDPDALEDMESSVLMMDVIFRLKVAFPEGVFFLLGNHDSFSAELMKDGVPQGMIWDRYLTRLRGEEYRDEMQRFYTLCPLLLISGDLVACHAGAPRVGITRQMLVDVREHPTLLYELTWNRQMTRGHAGGYTRADVRRLFGILGMADDSTLVVGHYPRSDDSSVWLNAGGLAGHHVLVSSRHNEVAVLTRVDGRVVTQIYRTERLIPWIVREAADRTGPAAAPETPSPTTRREAVQDPG